MKLKEFAEIILNLQLAQKKWENLYDLGIDLTNYDEAQHKIIDILLTEYYTIEGADIISWWLYENVKKHIYKKNSKTILYDVTTIKQLWTYVEKIKNKKK